MRPTPVIPPVASPGSDVAAIDGKFLSITSYKRDGTGVATPVWFVPDGGRYLVMTEGHSRKAKRRP